MLANIFTNALQNEQNFDLSGLKQPECQCRALCSVLSVKWGLSKNDLFLKYSEPTDSFSAQSTYLRTPITYKAAGIEGLHSSFLFSPLS